MKKLLLIVSLLLASRSWAANSQVFNACTGCPDYVGTGGGGGTPTVSVSTNSVLYSSNGTNIVGSSSFTYNGSSVSITFDRKTNASAGPAFTVTGDYTSGDGLEGTMIRINNLSTTRSAFNKPIELLSFADRGVDQHWITRDASYDAGSGTGCLGMTDTQSPSSFGIQSCFGSSLGGTQKQTFARIGYVFNAVNKGMLELIPSIGQATAVMNMHRESNTTPQDYIDFTDAAGTTIIGSVNGNGYATIPGFTTTSTSTFNGNVTVSSTVTLGGSTGLANQAVVLLSSNSAPIWTTIPMWATTPGVTTTTFMTSGTSWSAATTAGSTITVECIGGGGGGNSSNETGGGGGEYGKSTFTYVSGSVISGIQVGQGGGQDVDGTESHWNTNALICKPGLTSGPGGSGGNGFIHYNGGAGGSGSSFAAALGGGGAAGPLGAGGNGGNGTSNQAGTGGGGNGGGSNGGVQTGSAIGTVGGDNQGGTGHGSGGTNGSTAGTPGTNGGGGGGGYDSGTTGTNGGNGGTGTEWDASHGSGGGGGGGGYSHTSGNGALYGGGGAGKPPFSTTGTGANGIIAITYTPAGAISVSSGNFIVADSNNNLKGYDLLNSTQTWTGTNTVSTMTYTAHTFATLGNAAPNGTYFYCSDCTTTTPATCTANLLSSCVCAGSGTGAFVKRLNGSWYCN